MNYDVISSFTAVNVQPMGHLVAPVDLENQDLLKTTLEAHGCTITKAGRVFLSEMQKEAVLLKITFPEKTMKHIGIFSTRGAQLYTVVFPDRFEFRVREVYKQGKCKVIVMLPKAAAN